MRNLENEWKKFLLLEADLSPESVVYARRAMAIGAVVGMNVGVGIVANNQGDAEAQGRLINEWAEQARGLLRLPV